MDLDPKAATLEVFIQIIHSFDLPMSTLTLPGLGIHKLATA